MNTMVLSIYMFFLHQLILVRIDAGDLRLQVLQQMFCWFVSGVVVVVAATAAAIYVSAAAAASPTIACASTAIAPSVGCAACFSVAASAAAAATVDAHNGLELQLHTFHSHVIKFRS
jgi:hypothetical protein